MSTRRLLAMAVLLAGLAGAATGMCAALVAHADVPAAIGPPTFDLPHGRKLVAVEGYGLRCAVVWSANNALGAAGSGVPSCVLPIVGTRYWGHWRYVEPE